MIIRKAPPAILLMALSLASCGKAGPEETAQKFWTAMQYHDEKTALATLDPAEVARFAGAIKRDVGTPVRRDVHFSFKPIQQTDTTATLMMTIVDPKTAAKVGPITMPITMKKIDGTWFAQLVPSG